MLVLPATVLASATIWLRSRPGTYEPRGRAANVALLAASETLREADDMQHTTAPHCLGIMHRNCAHTIMYQKLLEAYANLIRWYLTKRKKLVFTRASFAAANALRAAVGACGRSNRQASLLHAYSHWTGMPCSTRHVLGGSAVPANGWQTNGSIGTWSLVFTHAWKSSSALHWSCCSAVNLVIVCRMMS
eukprot:321122-Pleurochrysis_carterae.AAC.1